MMLSSQYITTATAIFFAIISTTNGASVSCNTNDNTCPPDRLSYACPSGQQLCCLWSGIPLSASQNQIDQLTADVSKDGTTCVRTGEEVPEVPTTTVSPPVTDMVDEGEDSVDSTEDIIMTTTVAPAEPEEVPKGPPKVTCSSNDNLCPGDRLAYKCVDGRQVCCLWTNIPVTAGQGQIDQLTYDVSLAAFGGWCYRGDTEEAKAITQAPTTAEPSKSPTLKPSKSPSLSPVTQAPSPVPITSAPVDSVTTMPPTRFGYAPYNDTAATTENTTPLETPPEETPPDESNPFTEQAVDDSTSSVGMTRGSFLVTVFVVAGFLYNSL